MAVLYELGNVRIDSDFARFGSKSFAIKQINSVDVRHRHVAKPSSWILVGVIAVIFLVAGVFVLGALCAAVAAFLWYRGKEINEYHLYLTTSSSEAQACQSDSEADVRRLREAIEAAMAEAHRN